MELGTTIFLSTLFIITSETYKSMVQFEYSNFQMIN